MAAAQTARLIASLELNAAKFASGVKVANSSMSSLEKRFGKLGGIASQGLATAARNIERIGLLAGGAAVGGIIKATQAAGDFEAQLNTINTIALLPQAQLTTLGQGIRDTAKKSGQSLDDLTAAYYDLLSAGIKVTDAQGVLDQAVTLGIGALGTTTETVDLLTTAINAYGLDSVGAAKATDQFAQAVADGKVTVSEISGSFADVASVAKNAGIGINQIATAYGYLTAQGVPAAEVTTEMNRAIVELLKPNANLNKLQKTTKTNFAEMAKSKGLVPTLEAMRVAAQKAGIPFQNLFGRLEGYKFALQTTGPAFDAYMAEQKKVDDANGTAQTQAAERMKGFNFAISRLKTNVHDAAITIGDQLLPVFADLAGEMTTWLSGHQDEVKTFAKNLGAGVRDAVQWAKSLDWKSIGDGLKTAADFAKGLIDTFTHLPPQAQATIVALAGLNKLSGGAVAGIVGELGKGLIKGVLGMTAGVVNIKAGVVTGGGGGGNPLSKAPVVTSGGGGLLAAAGGLSGLLTLAAGLAVPFIMTAIIPEIFKNGGSSQGTSVTGSDKQNFGNLSWQQVGMTGLGNQLVGQKPVPTYDAAMTQKLDAINASARSTAEKAKSTDVAVNTAARSQAESATAAKIAAVAAQANRRASEALFLPISSQGQQLAAIARQRQTININVPITTSVTVRDTAKATTTTSRYGTVWVGAGSGKVAV